jgi:peptidylprolyl isomerase
MNRFIYVALLSFIFLSAFSQTNAVKLKANRAYTSKSGLTCTIFTIHQKAVKADSGDVVSVHYIGKLVDGTVFDNSYDRLQPISFPLGAGRVIKGWDEGIQYLHLGDSALFVIPASIAYGNRAVGKIPANSDLHFTVKLVDVKKAVKPYDAAGFDTVKLDNGLAYIIVQKGKGDGVAINQKALVQYTGYFTNGKKFDSSYDNGGKAFDFILGRHRVILGWEQGVVGMKIGEKRKLLVPYALAYGEAGRTPIPAKADLVFDIELEGIEKLNYPSFDFTNSDTVKLESGLKYLVAETTNAYQIKTGDTAIIQYIAYTADGNIFDSSYDRGDSLMFTAGTGWVIPGLDEGIQKMKVGEKMRFFIPYQLGYGEEGREPIIPAKANLVFDVYLQGVRIAAAKLDEK